METWAPKFDVNQLHKRLAEFLELRSLWSGEFYPLLTPTSSEENWLAYQLHRGDLGRGAVVAFRRRESPYRTAELSLRRLRPDAAYQVVFKDILVNGAPLAKLMTGEGLAHVAVTIERKRDSALITYREIPSRKEGQS